MAVIDEPAASNVRRIFEMRAKGFSPSKIAQTLNHEKISTSSDYREQKFSVPNTCHSQHLWSCDTVKQSLNTPSTFGILCRCAQPIFHTKTRKSSSVIPRDMIWVYNTHKAIVPQELWDKCREDESLGQSGREKQNGICQFSVGSGMLRGLRNENAHQVQQYPSQPKRAENLLS